MSNDNGNASVDSVSPAVDGVSISGTGITDGNGDLGLGASATITLAMSAPVIVDTTEGTPTLALNDGGTATYAGGSGTSALTFTYNVLAGQNTADLATTGLSLNGGSIADAAGNAADLQGAIANPPGTLKIDTTSPSGPTVLDNSLGGPDGFGTNFLAPNDDSSTSAIDITSIFPNGLNLFGTAYDQIYINNNGNITFTGPLSEYTPQSIGTGYSAPIIAPFWADVDTRGGSVTSTGGGAAGSDLVWYNLDPTQRILKITWDDVGYYDAHKDKVDAFQLQITAEANGTTDVKFIYQAVQWVTGDVSDGIAARIGYSGGDGSHYYEVPESGNSAALLALPTTLGNTGLPGIFQFTISSAGTLAPGNGSAPPTAPTALSLDPSTDSGTTGDALTNFSQITIDGLAQPDVSVSLYDGTTLVGQGQTDRTGAFAILTSALADGLHDLTAIASDSSDQLSAASAAYAVTIDTTAPVVTITNPSLVVDAAAQTVTGLVDAADAGTTLSLYDNGSVIGTATVGAGGAWSTAITLPSAGANVLLAKDTDAAGNSGSSTVITYTLESAPTPLIVTLTSPAVSTNQAAQTFTGIVTGADAATRANQTITLIDNGNPLGHQLTLGSDGSFTAEVTLPDQGANVIEAIAEDPLGNQVVSGAITDSLDSVAPTLTIASPALTTDQSAQTLTGTMVSAGTAAVAGEIVTLTDNGSVFGSATVDGNGNWTADVTLTTEGANAIAASAQDSDGNAATSAAITDILSSGVISAPTNQGTGSAGPIIAFDPSVSFSSPTNVLFTGTVADSAGLTGVEIFQGSNDLGAATLKGDGTFSFDYNFGRGFQTGLQAVATDQLGASATAPSDFDLTTGIQKAPYTAQIDNYDSSGNYLGSSQFTRTGTLYLSSSFRTLNNGDQATLYADGTYFAAQDYYAYQDVVTPNGNLAKETMFNTDGSHDITGHKSGLTIQSIYDDTMTGGGGDETFAFKPHFGHAVITDFQVGGASHDILSLSSQDFASIAEILQNTKTEGNNAVIHVSNHDTITLLNVTKADLSAHQSSDFKLHA